MASDEKSHSSSWSSKAEKMLSHLKADFRDYDASSQVANFYANRSVLITGATGFIGKALVEKLVRSAKDIRRIYLLIREKRGKDVKKRLADLIQSPIFSRIRSLPEGNKLLEDKLRAIRGNITEPNFGISPEDMSELSAEVSLVFNSAASIRFVEPLDVAVRNNIYSVSQLVEVCNQLNKLQALVHLSTAFSNCHKRDTIYETLYEPPMRGDQIIETVKWLKASQEGIRKADWQTEDLQRFYPDSHNEGSSRLVDKEERCGSTDLPESILDEFSRVALRSSNRPNVYTLTKAISESYLIELLQRKPERYLNDRIPVAVVRPSIVGGAWREPHVGFVDNYSGPTGPILALYTGALQAMPGNGRRVADMVPCDMVVNFLLSAAYLLTVGDRSGLEPSSGAFVFNFVSGFRNPLRWGQVTEEIAELAYEYPVKMIVRLPSSYFVRAGYLYELYDLLNNRLPAALRDFFQGTLLCRTLDERSSASGTYARIRSMTRALTPFTSNQWRLSDSNVCALYRKLAATDRELFEFNVQRIVWKDYLRNYIIGARIYTLKDSAQNVPGALETLKKKQTLYRATLSVLLLLFYYFFVRLLR